MDPVLSANSIVLLDRHYNSLLPVQPPRPNIYAVNFGGTLIFRYVSYEANRLILRPHSLDHPVELLRPSADDSPSAAIIGRVCITIAAL